VLKKSLIPPTLLLIVIWGLLSYRLSTPLFGTQDAGRIWIAASVRNYDLYGLENTGLMVVRNEGPATPETLMFYSHHPPLVTWLPALFTKLVGYHELGIRYVFAAATLLGAAGLYSLTRKLYGATVAFWALAFYGLVPMVTYFGRVAGHDPLGMMAALLFGAVIVRWLDRPTRGRYRALVGLAVLAVWTAWPAVFFVAWLGLAAMALGRRSQRVGVVGLGVTAVAAFVVMMVFYQLQWPYAIQSLLDAFVWRSSDAMWFAGSESFTMGEFLTENSAHLIAHTTYGVVVLGVVGVVVLWRYGNRRGNVFLLALLLSGLTYLLTFRNAAYIHDYYKLVLIPAIAVSAAMAWVYVPRLFPQPPFVYRLGLIAIVIWAISDGNAQFARLHRSGMRPGMQTVIDLVREHTTEADVIYTNSRLIWDFVLPVQYYAFRNIQHSTPLAQAQADAAQSDAAAFYLYCPTQTNQVDIPPALAAQAVSGGGCHLMPLTGS
jgi:hypothetical protein